MHPIFHVSLLKRHVKSDQQVYHSIPSSASHLQIPVRFIDRRMIPRGDKLIAQVLVKWSHSPASMATWEDQEVLKQQFPRAPAWGQAVSSPGGIVSSPTDKTATTADELQGEPARGEQARPKRSTHAPARLRGPEWAR